VMITVGAKGRAASAKKGGSRERCAGHLTCPPDPSTDYVSPRHRFEYSKGVDPNSELCGLSSL